jgi:2,4-didehydro-3-deoxy-L-rhamnonate hydrolase
VSGSSGQDWNARAQGLGLVRFGPPDAEKPGVVVPPLDGDAALGPLRPGSILLDVSSLIGDCGEAFFTPDIVARLRHALSAGPSGLPEISLQSVRFGPPVTRPSKLVAIGLNYRAHAVEMGSKIPGDPMLFMKATTAISGVTDVLELPPNSSEVDYEVELALVIAQKTPRGGVTPAEASAYIAGYTICNDYSERDWQKNRHGQFVKGKSADGFAPLGPVLVPADRLDPKDLRLWLSVNGEPRQDGRTSDLIFDVPKLVSAISGYMTLLPGDVITTGTPSGVGMGRTPPTYLKAGDIVEYGIEGIGIGRQVVAGFEG